MRTYLPGGAQLNRDLVTLQARQERARAICSLCSSAPVCGCKRTGSCCLPCIPRVKSKHSPARPLCTGALGESYTAAAAYGRAAQAA